MLVQSMTQLLSRLLQVLPQLVRLQHDSIPLLKQKSMHLLQTLLLVNYSQT